MRAPRMPSIPLFGWTRSRGRSRAPGSRFVAIWTAWLVLAATGGTVAPQGPTGPGLAGVGAVTTSIQPPVYLEAGAAESSLSGVEGLRKRLELQIRPVAPDGAMSSREGAPPFASRSAAARRRGAALRVPTLSVGVLLPYRSTAPPAL